MTMGNTRDVHVMTPGGGVADSFNKVIKSEKFRVDAVYVFEHKSLKKDIADENIEEMVDAIDELKQKCEDWDIDFSTWDIEEIAIDEIVSAAIEIKKKEIEKCPEEKDLRVFFNVTHGTKVYSIGSFLSSLWINAKPYYINKNKGRIELLEIPKVEPYKVQKNPNYLPILKILDEHDEGLSNKKILNQMEKKDLFTRVRNKGKTEKLTPGNLSSMLRSLEEWDLITIEEGRSRRENSNKITQNGRLMLKVIEDG